MHSDRLPQFAPPFGQFILLFVGMHWKPSSQQSSPDLHSSFPGMHSLPGAFTHIDTGGKTPVFLGMHRLSSQQSSSSKHCSFSGMHSLPGGCCSMHSDRLPQFAPPFGQFILLFVGMHWKPSSQQSSPALHSSFPGMHSLPGAFTHTDTGPITAFLGMHRLSSQQSSSSKHCSFSSMQSIDGRHTCSNLVTLQFVAGSPFVSWFGTGCPAVPDRWHPGGTKYSQFLEQHVSSLVQGASICAQIGNC